MTGYLRTEGAAMTGTGSPDHQANEKRRISNIEDALMHALETVPVPEPSPATAKKLTGADLIAARPEVAIPGTRD